MKRKIVRSALLGILALLGCGVMIGVWQVCFVKSFFLHAMVFPMNPKTVSQPTDFTYIGQSCQGLALFFLALGILFCLRAVWLLYISRRNHVG